MNASFFVSNLTAVPLFVTLYCDKRLQNSNLHVGLTGQAGPALGGGRVTKYRACTGEPTLVCSQCQLAPSAAWPGVAFSLQ